MEKKKKIITEIVFSLLNTGDSDQKNPLHSVSS